MHLQIEGIDHYRPLKNYFYIVFPFLMQTFNFSQDNVIKELDNIFQGSDRLPTINELNEMKYLERVIKEALRLYPSVPFIGRELESDLKIGK